MRSKLKEGESVRLITKLHPIAVLTPFMWVVLIGLILPVFASTEVTIVVITPFALIGLWKILDRRTNLWIVTNKRVIDESGVITFNVKESPLTKIHNVDYRQDVLGRMLGYGSILIQTAAGAGATEHKLLNDPAKLKDAITDEIENYSKNNLNEPKKDSFTDSGSHQENIKSKITQLKSLLDEGLITEEDFNKKKQILLDNL